MSACEERWIGHLDMDAFFAAVEQLDHPAYRGRPVIVGGLGPRGVVSTASYEARPYGVHSAMPMALAQKRCPGAVFVSGRFERYHQVSQHVRRILRRAAPTIETVSLDEAFFDLSSYGRGAESVARQLKAGVDRETGLTCSVGVAPNRFLAKMGSELSKPNGFLAIHAEEVRALLDPLPVGTMWGVGEVTERRLRGLGLLRVADVRQAPLALLVREFGSFGPRLQELSRGEDTTEIATEVASVSMSREVTYDVDLVQEDEVEAEVRRLAALVTRELHEAGMLCRTVRIKVRYPDFRTITRQVRLRVATDASSVIEALAVHLLRQRTPAHEEGVRLLGVGLAHLSGRDACQLALFSDAPTGT